MAAEPNKNSPGNADAERAKMMRVLIPAGAIALVVVLVAVIASLSGSDRKMSDGSNGSADDPDLKQVATGVKIRDIKEGDGPSCQPGAKVKMNYTGWLTDGTVFDTSQGKGPLERGLGELIEGWQQGIPGMKPGGIRKLVVEPAQGYGNRASGKIPAGSTLIFEVELLSSSPGLRPRRSPSLIDLTKLSDGTLPTAIDPDLKPIGTSGLMYRDIKVGDGEIATAGATVIMDYTGWRLKDGKMFDSSWKAGEQPLKRPLSGLIKGWQEGVPGMKVGGVRKLVIPPQLGYPAGAGEDIPPGTTLVFEIDLLGLK